jgi:hypothetical protein
MNKRQLSSAGLLLSMGVFLLLGYLSQYPLCGGYPDWRSSPYVLPYPVGKSYGVHQANCTSGGIPHLHFHVAPCSEPVSCGTLPVTFRNTDANPKGLKANRS